MTLGVNSVISGLGIDLLGLRSLSPRSSVNGAGSPAQKNTLRSLSARFSRSKASVDHLVSIVRLRISQETSLAVVTERLAGHSPPMLGPDESLIGYCISSYSLSLQGRAKLSRQLARDFEHEILNPLVDALKRTEERYKQVDRGVDTIEKSLQSEYKSHDDCLIEFDRVGRSTEQIVNDWLTARDALPPAERLKFGSRVATACRDSIRAETDYHTAVDRVNRTRKTHSERTAELVRVMAEVEQEWREAVDAGVQKLIVYEISKNRNEQYENEKIFKQIEEGDITPPPPCEHPSQSPTEPVSIISLGEISEAGIRLPPPHIIQSVESRIVDLVWSESAHLSRDSIEAAGEPIRTSLGRLSLCETLSQQPATLPSISALGSLGRILNPLLDACEEESDSDAARRVAGFAQRFHAVDPETGKKKFLQSEVYHHSIWNRVSLWEDCLQFVLIENNLNNYLNYRNCQHSTSSIMTLDNFGNFLLMFGINSNSSIDIIKRTIQKYSYLIDNVEGVLDRLVKSVLAAEERQKRNVATLQSPPPVVSI